MLSKINTIVKGRNSKTLTSILKEDDRFFVKASAQAQQTADYILARR